MAYRLFYFIGRFVHDSNFAAIQTDEKTRIARPKVKQPLDEADVRQSAIVSCGGDAGRVSDWDIKIENNQIVFCEFSDAKALAWVLELVRSKNLDVIEGGTMRVIPKSELNSLADSTA